MRFDVRHFTLYRYPSPVFLEPHTLRLRPRSDGAQRLLTYELSIDPKPSAVADVLDAEGNASSRAWFAGAHETLRIETRFRVEMVRTNPFDFVLEPEAEDLGSVYNRTPMPLLSPYRVRASEAPAVNRLAGKAALDAGNKTIPFLTLLATRLREQLRSVVRPTGFPYAPAECLEKGEGSCRDLAVLFMDACRAQGLAARFVSGVHEAAPQGERHLHAWAEVFLPGGGWRGFDPSVGLAVTQSHIVLATGQAPTAAAPITGSYRGDGPGADLETHLEISAVPADA
ncbi:MAG: transglutaminase family protein [Planctomycetota bacterium]|nr:transglutaminase family protein [Planctomycetota bacterium]